jgi:predicted sulfurtransferase
MARSVLLAMTFLAALLPTARAQEQDEAPRITQQEFKKLLAAKNVIVVDTRNPDAYPLGHIPGAVLLPLEGQLTWPEDYQSTVDMLKRSGKPVVTYCA